MDPHAYEERADVGWCARTGAGKTDRRIAAHIAAPITAFGSSLFDTTECARIAMAIVNGSGPAFAAPERP